MRKLESKKDIKKRQKRNQWTLGIVMIVILFGSIFGTFLNLFGSSANQSSELTYRGIPLIQQGNLYALQIGDKAFYFMNNPNEVAGSNYNVNITKTIPQYVGKPLYLDSFEYTASQEIAQNFQGYPERMANACIDETDCIDNNAPIKTCEDNIIIIRETNQNKVYEVENCIYIEGKSEDLVKITDAFLLKTLGLN